MRFLSHGAISVQSVEFFQWLFKTDAICTEGI